MSKHTPGPWLTEKVVAGRPTDRGVGVIAVDPEISGTEIRTPTRGIVAWACGRVGQTAAETLANAALIAAAPELLAALKAVNKIIAEGAATGFRPLDGDWAERLFSSQQATSRAIAKAEGKSP